MYKRIVTIIICAALLLAGCSNADVNTKSDLQNKAVDSTENNTQAVEPAETSDTADVPIDDNYELEEQVEQVNAVMWDNSWEYFSDTTNSEYLGLMNLLCMKNALGTHTSAVDLMTRKYYESVDENSLEAWINNISAIPENSFSEKIVELLNEKNYDGLNQSEKAFLDYYIRYSLFNIEQYEGVEEKKLGYLEEVWILNDEGNDYYDLAFKNSDGSTIHAPKELVMKFSGNSKWESVFFFSDFNNENNHCVYHHTIDDKCWKIIDDGKYVMGDFSGFNSLKSQNEKLVKEHLKHGPFYIREDGSVVWAKKIDVQPFNQIINDYSEFYDFMQLYSQKIYKPYYDDVEKNRQKSMRKN